MKDFLSLLRGALVSTAVFTLILCGFYPVAVWAIGQAAFKDKANGGLIVDANGTVRGSSLIGQNFTGDGYFHPRPSAAGANGYDGAASGGSNLGPTSQKLAEQIKERVAAYRLENSVPDSVEIPVSAVTASASGLDPHISPRDAELQTARVAKARNLPEERVRELTAQHTERRFLGILGEPGVNVLKLNLSLDAAR